MCTYEQLGHTRYQIRLVTGYQGVTGKSGDQELEVPSKSGDWVPGVPGKSGDHVPGIPK